MYPSDDFGKRAKRSPNVADFFFILANVNLVPTMGSIHSTLF